jgi:hypothetical protein
MIVAGSVTVTVPKLETGPRPNQSLSPKDPGCGRGQWASRAARPATVQVWPPLQRQVSRVAGLLEIYEIDLLVCLILLLPLGTFCSMPNILYPHKGVEL